MKTLAVTLLAMLALAISLPAQDAAVFANFAGTFSRKARIKVAGSDGPVATGRISQRFTISEDGLRGLLHLRGTVELNGAIRRLSTTYIFRRPTEEGLRVAAISNLAPGIDDGYSADKGTYRITPRSIRAEIPFVFGTTAGTVTLWVRLKARKGIRQLLATQTLTANTLLRPVTWNFKGLEGTPR